MKRNTVKSRVHLTATSPDTAFTLSLKRGFISMLILCACLVLPELAQAQKTRRDFKPGPRFPRTPGLPNTSRVAGLPSPHLPATATHDAIPTTCPPEAAGAVCGYVKVPLDRKHPGQGKIQIYFELYPHSGSGPAESAILADVGGPGVTTTGLRDGWLGLYGANRDVHDILLIDDRGRGLSNTIDCAELQHGTVPFDQAEGDCAAQLGDAASRYGTGDIAKDTEAVRAALGYDKVDYHGGSYGGADVTAYATRFGQHLRSIVLDAPYSTPELDPFVAERDQTHAMPRKVRLDCLRSPTCSPDHPNPNAELNALISYVRSNPVEGDAYDINGTLVHVLIDEDAVLNYLVANPTGNFASTGEILAAATSLWQRDSRPLLRLGAEGFFPLEGDSGDPTFFSRGALYATSCVDAHEPWNWSAAVSKRKVQFAHAVSALPSNAFAPFSKAAATSLLFSAVQCIWWEKPTPSSPIAPDDADYPHVPTLVLTGDLDTLVPIEATSKVAALFPDSTSVTIPEAGHETVFWAQCARDLASSFVETLQVGDTRCADTPETIYPAVGRFPLLAKNARPAAIDQNGNNQIGTAERKAATVAVAAATDALQRSLIGFFDGGFGDGVGLRAGTFHADYSDPWTITLTNCAFAKDVMVTGTITWAFNGDQSFVADFAVSGSGTAGGTLHVEGTWQAPVHKVGQFKVSGALGGKQVAVLVPEA